MKLWLEYHGLGLGLIFLAGLALPLGEWFPVANVASGVLLLIGVFRACDGHQAWQDLLKARRERGEP
jgi:hypothetical protein